MTHLIFPRYSITYRAHTRRFSPLDLSPELWYDIQDASTVFQDSALTTPALAASGHQVGGIIDKSGNDNTGTQTTSNNKPTLQSNNTLLFDGTNDRIAIPNLSLDGTANATICLTYKQNTTTSGADTPLSFGGSLESQWQTSGSPEDAMVVYFIGILADNASIIPSGLGDVYTSLILRTDGTDVKVWQNSYVSPVTDVSQAGNWSTGAGAYGLGATNSDDRNNNMNFIELIIYKSAVADNNIPKLMNHLNKKRIPLL